LCPRWHGTHADFHHVINPKDPTVTDPTTLSEETLNEDQAQDQQGQTQTGIVKWFDDGKGYGFIAPDEGGKDLFAHFSEIRSSGGFRTLKEGQKVEFTVKQGPKGLQASDIRPL
jgi:CspA family cold shock protein